MLMNGGKPFEDLIVAMNETIQKAGNQPSLEKLVGNMEKITAKLLETGRSMPKLLLSDKMLTAFSLSYPFLKVMGESIMGWMHIWRATVAIQKLEEKESKKSDIDFYQGQIKTAEFFINTVLPPTLTKMDVLLEADETVTMSSVDSPTGAVRIDLALQSLHLCSSCFLRNSENCTTSCHNPVLLYG
jgi:hypothetical protein